MRGGAFALVLLGAAVAFAGTAGTLDAAFDGDGVARLGMGDGGFQDVLVQPDGKVLVSGPTGATPSPVVVARYLTTGGLDGSFGSAGVAAIPAMSVGGSEMALLADGRILVTGRAPVTVTITSGSGKKATTTTVTYQGAAVARLNADGTLDTSFGTGGVAKLLPAGSTRAGFTSVLVRPDGRVVAAGTADQPGWTRRSASQEAILLAQFTTAGSLDASFASGGVRLEDLSSSADHPRPRSLVLQSDGSVVMGCGVGPTTSAAMRRYLADGTPDTAFGTQVVAGMTYLMALQGDSVGRLVATGRGPNGGTADQAAVARFLPDGSVDTSFGVGGTRFLLPPGAASSQAYSVGFAADGGLLVPVDVNPASGRRQSSVVRLTDSGVVDPGFGGGGYSPVLDLGLSSTQGYSCTVGPDGNVLLAGYATDAFQDRDGFVARFFGN